MEVEWAAAEWLTGRATVVDIEVEADARRNIFTRMWVIIETTTYSNTPPALRREFCMPLLFEGLVKQWQVIAPAVFGARACELRRFQIAFLS